MRRVDEEDGFRYLNNSMTNLAETLLQTIRREENYRGKERKGKSDRGRAKSHAGNEI